MTISKAKKIERACSEELSELQRQHNDLSEKQKELNKQADEIR
jgi:hypothetical protein